VLSRAVVFTISHFSNRRQFNMGNAAPVAIEEEEEVWIYTGSGATTDGGGWTVRWVRDNRIPLKYIGTQADKIGSEPKTLRLLEVKNEEDGWLSETFGRVIGKEKDKYWYSPKHGIRFRSLLEVSRFKYFMLVTGRDEADAWLRLQELGGIQKWSYWDPAVEPGGPEDETDTVICV
jgi:hypothetical protein